MTASGADEPAAASVAGPLPFSRILVTGADGFVGRALLPVLRRRLSASATIHRASRTAAPDRPEICLFDLEDPASVDRAVRDIRPDLVIHLAAQSSVGQSIGGGRRTWTINMGGSLALGLALARHCPECTLFYTSSAEVYGRNFNSGIATEATPLAPQSAYSRSKAATEAMFSDVLPETARLVIVRPSNHIGPGQDVRFVVPSFAAQIVAAERGDQPPTVSVGNLDARRDFMDVRDVVAAYLALLAQAPQLPARTVFNVASGDTISIDEILQRLRAASSAPVDIVVDPARVRPSEIPVAALDASRLRNTVTWRPRHPISDTLAAIVDDLRRSGEGSTNGPA